MPIFSQENPFTLIWRIERDICVAEIRIESSPFKTYIDETEEWNLVYQTEGTDLLLSLNCRKYKEIEKQAIIFHKFELICPEGDNIVSEEKQGIRREGEVGCYRIKWEDFEKKILFQPSHPTIQISMWGNFSCNVNLTRIILHSKHKIEKLFLMWNIKNFSSCVTDSKDIIFSEILYAKLVISLAISDDDEIKIFIKNEGILMYYGTLKGEIFLLDSNGCIRDGRADEYFYPSNVPRFNLSWEFPSFLKKSNLTAQKSTFLVNDVLSLQCRFFYEGSEIANEVEYVYGDFLTPSAVKNCYDRKSLIDDNNSNERLNMFQKDLQLLYTGKKMTDVTFRIGDKTISAHKCVLAARSPVFSAMFEHEMSKNRSRFVEFFCRRDIVDVIDVNFNILDKMLMFMYGTKVPDLDYESARELMIAADKYQVLALKEECSSVLRSCISDETVCQILVISLMVQDKQLITSSIEYIKSNTKNIIKSEGWKQLVKTNSEFTTQILTMLVLD